MFMGARTYQVKAVAQLANVTVRTLHHYDTIGLLTPSGRTEAGYRLYREQDLLRLHQIVLGRELGLSLERIRQMLDDPELDRKQVLLEQREQLVERASRTGAMIRSIDVALAALKGDKEMNANELFDGFDPAEHADEAKERWGNGPAFAEASRRTRRYTKEDWARIKQENDELMKRLASALHGGARATDVTAMDLAEEHREQIDRWYYPCSVQMHAALADMYTADARFAASFDKYGEGMATFLAEAIRANAQRS